MTMHKYYYDPETGQLLRLITEGGQVTGIRELVGPFEKPAFAFALADEKPAPAEPEPAKPAKKASPAPKKKKQNQCQINTHT